MTNGIGVIVVMKSATQLMMPHMRVATPSSKQYAPGTPPGIQYALTGTHRKIAMKGYEMKIPRV
jgi:hypothetical protein